MKIEKITSIICVAIMFVIGFTTLLADNKQPIISEHENRMLAGMPELTIENIISGSFAVNFEKYMIDRIPMRNKIISLQSTLSQSLSVVTMDDTLKAADTTALQQTENTEEEISAIAPETAAAPDEAPDSDKFGDAQYKSIMVMNNETQEIKILRSFETNDIKTFAQTLNQLEALLPDEGHLVNIMCLESSKARPAKAHTTQNEPITMIDETLDVLDYYTPDNVHAISPSVLFEEPMESGRQMYFFTDNHWSVEGAHLIYTEAMKQIGITPLEWDDYRVTYEYPFRGAYYKNDPADYYIENPDTLAILSFSKVQTYTHYLGEDNAETLTILNQDAPNNDRYRIYFDGPQAVGPFSVIETANSTGSNALIVLDSYGLPFANMLIPHYDSICMMDLRYMYKSTTRYYIEDVINEYNIEDVFIVLGDINGYGTYYHKLIDIYLHSDTH